MLLVAIFKGGLLESKDLLQVSGGTCDRFIAFRDPNGSKCDSHSKFQGRI